MSNENLESLLGTWAIFGITSHVTFVWDLQDCCNVIKMKSSLVTLNILVMK